RPGLVRDAARGARAAPARADELRRPGRPDDERSRGVPRRRARRVGRGRATPLVPAPARQPRALDRTGGGRRPGRGRPRRVGGRVLRRARGVPGPRPHVRPRARGRRPRARAWRGRGRGLPDPRPVGCPDHVGRELGGQRPGVPGRRARGGRAADRAAPGAAAARRLTSRPARGWRTPAADPGGGTPGGGGAPREKRARPRGGVVSHRGMVIETATPRVEQLGEVLDAVRAWQDDAAPLQLHPGDVGWFWRFGATATAAALRTWRRDGRVVAVGLLDGPDLLRLGVAPDLLRDDELARR